MLEKNIELYQELMSEVSPENVEFAKVYVSKEEEIIPKFKEWADEEIRDDVLEAFEERKLDIRFKGEGYYDIWEYSFCRELIIARIDEILKSEVDNLEIYTDPEAVIKKIKKNEEYKCIYTVFGVKHQGDFDMKLEYIVKTNAKLKEGDVYEILKENGISPYAWGCGLEETDKFYNFYVQELENLESEELQKYMDAEEYETFEFETEFDDIIGFSEATEMWGLADSTLRKAVANGKLREGIDCKKVGRDWVTTIEIMEREYGKASDKN